MSRFSALNISCCLGVYSKEVGKLAVDHQKAGITVQQQDHHRNVVDIGGQPGLGFPYLLFLLTYVCDVSVNASDADNVAIRRENGELADQDVARLALRIWNFSFHIHGFTIADNRHLEGVYVVSQRARSPVAYALPDYIIRCNIIAILEGGIDHH